MKIALIILAVFVLAVLLIFHDDRDPGYDKRERIGPADNRARKDAGVVPPPMSHITPSAPAAPVTRAEERFPEYYHPKTNPGVEKLSWSFLYGLEYDEDLDQDFMDCDVVGMQYNCGDSLLGLVNGTVVPEPGNVHDVRAQAVFAADGRKIGYIPKIAQDDYEEFNPDDLICPFAGSITKDESGRFHCEVRIVLPESRDYVKEELLHYLNTWA